MLLPTTSVDKRRSKRSASQHDRVGEYQRIQHEVRSHPAQPMRQARSRSHGSLPLFDFDQAGTLIHYDIVKKPLSSDLLASKPLLLSADAAEFANILTEARAADGCTMQFTSACDCEQSIPDCELSFWTKQKSAFWSKRKT